MFFPFIGGIVLPLLGAVPDSAIIIVSGLGDDAQDKLSVGMGYVYFSVCLSVCQSVCLFVCWLVFFIIYLLLFSTLAGSTIMLLTAAWAGSVLIGRCDLDRHGEALEQTGYGKFSCTKQVT